MATGAARVFIALWPDAPVRRRLAQWRDGWIWPRAATPVKTERLHATLHFLGNVERDRLPKLQDALNVPFEPFTLEFGHAELWPHGIAVLAPHAAPAPLFDLHEALGAALADLDIALDARAYRPHVTLARRAGNAAPPAEGPSFRWRIDRFALMESTTGADGGYTMLREYS